MGCLGSPKGRGTRSSHNPNLLFPTGFPNLFSYIYTLPPLPYLFKDLELAKTRSLRQGPVTGSQSKGETPQTVHCRFPCWDPSGGDSKLLLKDSATGQDSGGRGEPIKRRETGHGWWGMGKTTTLPKISERNKQLIFKRWRVNSPTPPTTIHAAADNGICSLSPSSQCSNKNNPSFINSFSCPFNENDSGKRSLCHQYSPNGLGLQLCLV